jgi:predicted protein tyrosine phosphatase
MADWTPNFSWAQPDLAVGGRFPQEQASALAARHGVGAVIDLRSEDCDDGTALDACGLRFLHLPTEDQCGVSQAMLDEAVAFTAAATREGRKVLIHCEHGIGRSAIAALCVLADRGMAPLQALATLKDARALVSPSEPQYRAWSAWLRRRTHYDPLTYHAFGVIAYRHLAASA